MHVLVDYRSKCALSGLSFQHFKSDEILNLSVKEITNPFALDRLLNPVTNGLYDLALGPLDKNDICLTCGLDYYQCAGHFGHIQLVLPLYNPVFFRELVKLLRSSCLSCHQLLTSQLEKDYFYAQMTLANNGLIEQLPLVDELYKKILASNADNVKLISRVSFRRDFEAVLLQITPLAHRTRL
jgi:DNA-directed RNA polymerase I subunit RPA1